LPAIVNNCRHLLFAAILGCCLLSLTSCRSAPTDILHGYLEGEFVYVSSPLAGTVYLQVAKGTRVKQGAPLDSLDSVPEAAARDEAVRRLAQAAALLKDLQKGQRPTELAALQARLQEAKAALALAESELQRQEKLYNSGTVSAQDYDRSRSAREQQAQLVARLAAELQTARLGGRSDQLAAAEANLRALEASLARAEWELAQKSRRAPADALVYDTFYRTGEYVAAGRPVVSLLPPENIKARCYVPEARLAAIHPGDPVAVTVDGSGETFSGRVSYVSPRAEYTPPVIYSREIRDKLVFMVEASFPPATAVRLNPGQPVDIRFGK
jgi:HlyD family secretion protein